MKIVRVQGNKDIFAPCERMATKIVETLLSNGKCAPSDMQTNGFSPEEVRDHWRMAYGLAKVELNWIES